MTLADASRKLPHSRKPKMFLKPVLGKKGAVLFLAVCLSPNAALSRNKWEQPGRNCLTMRGSATQVHCTNISLFSLSLRSCSLEDTIHTFQESSYHCVMPQAPHFSVSFCPSLLCPSVPVAFTAHFQYIHRKRISSGRLLLSPISCHSPVNKWDDYFYFC